MKRALARANEGAAAIEFALVLLPLPVRAQDQGGNHNDEGGSQVNGFSGLNAQQRATLYSIARESWRFY